MSSSAQGNARSGVGAESNCIYDDAGSAASGSSWSWTSSPRGAARGTAGASGNRGRSSLAVATSAPWSNAPSSAAAEPIRDGLPPATSPLRQSFLSRNRQPQQFGSVVLTKPSRLEPIRTCLTWIWLGPVIVTALAGLAVLFGTLCLTEQLVLFDTCGEILVPLGLLLPCAALLVAIYMSQPSTAGQQHDAFYSDALLEEVLAGENILDVYTVTTRGCPPRDGNVVVFLSGVGGVAETWRSHVEAVVDAGFAAIQIQLPGSGCLGAITFSFERAAQTVMRVIEQEVLDGPLEQDGPLGYGPPTAPGGLFANAEIVGAHHLSSQTLNPLMCSPPPRAVDTQVPGCQSKPGLTGTEGPPRRLVLVAWGLSCHVAMYLASSQRLGNAHLAGIVLCGSPPLPSWGLSWSSKLFYRAFRVSWIAQLARLSEYARMGPQNRRSVSLQSLRPQARADWGVSFEHSGESLRLACSSFLAPVLCLSSDPSYLDEVRAHFGGPLQESGSNVDGALLSGGRSASTQSFPPPSDEEIVAHILDFASMTMA